MPFLLVSRFFERRRRHQLHAWFVLILVMSRSFLRVLVLVASVPIIIPSISIVVISVVWIINFVRVAFSATAFVRRVVFPYTTVWDPAAVFRSNDDGECKMDNAL